jgi:hypothetical protein
MIATIENIEVDLSKPIDISIPITNTDANPIAWYIENRFIEPQFGEWIGSSFRYVIYKFNIRFKIMVTELIPSVWVILHAILQH